MSEITRLGHATETTAVVFFRAESDGVLTVQCNGSTFTGDTVSTATDDGTGIVTVTGLSAGKSYPFSLFLDSVRKFRGSLMTAPSSGDTFSVAYGSCIHPKREYTSMAKLDSLPNLRGYMLGGDTPYTDGVPSKTFGDVTITEVSAVAPTVEATTMTELYNHYRYLMVRPAMKSVIESMPIWACTDDHERVGDNWDWSIAQANVQNVWATTQLQVNNMGLWCRNAFHDYWKGTPENTHALNDSGFPDNEQLYYDFVYGDAHFIFVEAIEYSNITPGNTLGATQLSWLEDVLINSTSAFKVIVCGKTPNGHTDNNWAADLQSYVQTNNIFGIVCLGGDIHYPAVYYKTGLLQIRACPTSQVLASIGDDYDNGCIYRATGNSVTGLSERNIFFPSGFVTIEGSNRLIAGMIDQYGNRKVQYAIRPDKFGYESVEAQKISF